MKAKFIKENIDVEEWENQQEDRLEWKERMENWWKVEVHDIAAAEGRGMFVENWEALKRVAQRILERIDKDYSEEELEEATNIISQFIDIEIDPDWA